MSATDDLKAHIQKLSDDDDAVLGVLTGLQEQVADLQKQLADLTGGASAADIAAMQATVDGIDAKLQAFIPAPPV